MAAKKFVSKHIFRKLCFIIFCFFPALVLAYNNANPNNQNRPPYSSTINPYNKNSANHPYNSLRNPYNNNQDTSNPYAKALEQFYNPQPSQNPNKPNFSIQPNNEKVTVEPTPGGLNQQFGYKRNPYGNKNPANPYNNKVFQSPSNH